MGKECVYWFSGVYEEVKILSGRNKSHFRGYREDFHLTFLDAVGIKQFSHITRHELQNNQIMGGMNSAYFQAIIQKSYECDLMDIVVYI